MTASDRFYVGVDVGGTFTDVVCAGTSGELYLMKVPSTRSDPGNAIREAVVLLRAQHNIDPAAIIKFTHGTTVATNAVLERKGSRIGLLMTHGFRDVLEIGRSYRPEIYDMFQKPTTPNFLAPGERRRGVVERIGPDGAVITPLDEASLRSAIEGLLTEDIEAIAVSFLFSYLNPAHELRAEEILREMAPDIQVSLSHQVDPTFREYERTCVTAFDAYVKPVLNRYLANLEAQLANLGVAGQLQVLQSRGGLSSAAVARQRPVRLFLSGPAGGVLGARAVGAEVDEPNLISFDVGGTSCDIAVIQAGVPMVKSMSAIDGFTVRVPMVDVNAIGAGGGSIAWLDGGGGLRVGPHSAGSEPGPACYGRGGQKATVTDASIVLGYIDPDFFAGGTLRLSPDRSFDVIEREIAKPLGLTIEQAALGIHRVINSQMAEGIRFVSVQRGTDPRKFTLLPLGGGGGLHAIPLARELQMKKILVPRNPGVLAANGLLSAPIEHEASASFNVDLAECSVSAIEDKLMDLDAVCRNLMELESVAQSSVEISYFADICYIGQSHWIDVDLDLARLRTDGDLQSLYSAFLKKHAQIHGHGGKGKARIVNLRSVATVVAPPRPEVIDIKTAAAVIRPDREIVVEHHGRVMATVVRREGLVEGNTIKGPAIIEQMDTTTLIEPGWQATVVQGLNILIEPITNG